MSNVSAAERLIISQILQKHVPHANVWIFGSRSRDDARPFSDLDLVIIAEDPVDNLVLAELACDFEDSDLPYRVDLLDWHRLSDEFRLQIEQQGYEVFMNG